MGLWPLHTKGYTRIEFVGALAFATIGRFLNLRVATHAPKPPKTFQGWNLAGNRETGATHIMETCAAQGCEDTAEPHFERSTLSAGPKAEKWTLI